MNAVEHFERAMNHIRLAVEDLGMECGCSEKVELHIPERAFEPLVRSLKEKTMLYCSGSDWSYPATTFKYMGMKIILKAALDKSCTEISPPVGEKE